MNLSTNHTKVYSKNLGKKAKKNCLLLLFNYYSKFFFKYNTDSKRTSQVMKEKNNKQNQISSAEKLKLMKPICKTHKTLQKNLTIFLLLLDQS